MKTIRSVFLLRTCCVTAALLCFSAFAHAGRVTPVGAYASSQYNTTRTPMKTIDGSGLDANGCHDTDVANMWMNLGQTSSSQALMFQFSDPTPITAVKIWNFNAIINGGTYTERGAKKITFFYSDAVDTYHQGDTPFTDSNWVLLSTHELGLATGTAGYTGEPVIELDREISPRWFGIRIDSTHGTESYCGIAEVQFFNDQTPQVELGDITVTSATEATIAGTLTNDGGSDATVTVRYGTDAAALTESVSVSPESLGAYTLPLTGLTPDTGYCALTEVTNVNGDSDSGNAAQTFITGAVSLSVSTDTCFEDDTQQAPLLTLTRPAGTTNVTLSVRLAYGGTAVAAVDYEPVETVTFAAGESTVTVALPVLHNADSLTDTEVTVSVAAGAYLVDEAAESVSVTLVNVDNAESTTCTWTGLAGTLRLDDAGNWSPEGVPGAADTALFDSDAAAIADGTVLSYGSSLRIRTLIFRCAASLTLGSDEDVAAGNVLSFTDLTQTNNCTVTGLSFEHRFGAPFRLYPAADGNSVWDIQGAGEGNTYLLRLNGQLIADPDTVTLVKKGAGELRPYYATPDFGGTWRIYDGIVSGNCASNSHPGTVGGTFYVGGGDTPATLSSVRNALYGNSRITVLTNGFFTMSGAMNTYDRVYSVRVEEGGLVETLSNQFNCQRLTFKGGRVTDSGSVGRFFCAGWGQSITAEASEETAVLDCDFAFNRNSSATVTVEDGPRVIDLDASTGNFTYGADVLYRRGAGTLLLARNTLFENATTNTATGYRLEGGRTIFNNPAPTLSDGSGAGRSPMEVRASATLAGNGYLGGAPAFDTFAVTLTGSSGAPATLAPGSVDLGTGVSLPGTLTVGDGEKAHPVHFGSYSRFEAQIGTRGEADRLEVSGAVDIADVGTTIQVDVDPDAQAGTYVLLHAEGGITGTFATVEPTGAAHARYLSVTDTDILYTVLPGGTLLYIH